MHPRLLLALWAYGLCQGLSTAAGIAKACTLRDDFRWLAGGLRPCDQTLLNLISRGAGNDALTWIWVQLLWAIQDAGHIDLGAIFEDGTKQQANASPRSFHSAAEIAALMERMAAEIEGVLRKGTDAVVPSGEDKRTLRALQDKLVRAKAAASDLERRRVAREAKPASAQPLRPKFAVADFKLDAERNVLVCPEGNELTFRGKHLSTNRKQSYALYQRTNCRDCPVKDSCTDAPGRRVKVQDQPTQPVADAPAKTVAEPQASLTDPQAVLMPATSEKRFVPAYNADLSVTRQGFIVCQFLTQNPTDYHSFKRALLEVIDILGNPEVWVGDSHYGTLANLVLAHYHHVLLYAPPLNTPPLLPGPVASAPAGGSEASSPGEPLRFGREAFTFQEESNVMTCPGKKDLRFVNAYLSPNGATYKLYARTDCSDCALKERCTTTLGRRLKVPGPRQDEPVVASSPAALLAAQRERMASPAGVAALKVRGLTSEPANAHVKTHGIDRYHVRGLAKCSVILLIACLAHNLIKWHTREVARELAAAA